MMQRAGSLAPAGLPQLRRDGRRVKSRTTRPVVVAAEGERVRNPYFPPQRDGIDGALASMPTPVAMGVAGLLTAAAAAAGVKVGGSAAGKPGQVIGGAAAAAAVVAGAKPLADRRKKLSVGELQEVLSGLDDPRELTPDMVAAVAAKFGVDLPTEMGFELRPILFAFIDAVMPGTGGKLTGSEPATIRAFAATIGVQDEDLAAAFIDYGRQINRSRFETSSRAASRDEAQSFKRCIYVATRTLGEQKSAFLLPWARLFDISPELVVIAKRDCAKQLLQDTLGGSEITLDDASVSAIKARAADLGLQEAVTGEVVNELARKQVEGALDRAVNVVKARTRERDDAAIMKELTFALGFNERLAALGAAGDAGIPGLRPVTMLESDKVGSWGSNLRALFRAYVEHNTRDKMSDAAEASLGPLQKLLAMGPKDADAISLAVKSDAYRRKLREEYRSGRLEAAESPAGVLNTLVEDLHMDGDVAMKINREVFELRWDQLLEGKKLTEEGEAELTSLRRVLCITDEIAAQIRKDKTGKFYTRALGEAFEAGADGFGLPERNMVKKVMSDYRIAHETAVDLLKESARAAYMTFINQSRTKGTPLERARELKRLVFFSESVVAPLLEDAKGEEWLERDKQEAKEKRKQMKEIQKIMKEAQEKAKKEEEEGEGESAESPAAEAEVVEPEVAAEAAPAAEKKKEDDEEEGTITIEAEEATPTAEKKEEEEPKPEAAEAEEDEEDEEDEDDPAMAMMMAGPADINLSEELDIRDRKDIYKNYLQYAITGDVVTGPMGTVMQTERDPKEFERLSSLGKVLGLGQQDTVEIHQGMAEQAFRAQAEGLVADGRVTEDREARLKDLQTQLGLPDSSREKIVNGIMNKKRVEELSSLRAAGQLTLDKVMEVVEASGDPEGLKTSLPEDVRKGLYRDYYEGTMQNGKGEFSAEEVFVNVPTKLGLEADKLKWQVTKEAGTRKKLAVTQAMSDYRQGRAADAEAALNNVVSCQRANPDAEYGTQSEDDRKDIVCFYVSRVEDAEKRGDLVAALRLPEGALAECEAAVSSGAWTPKQIVDDKSFF
ncbi:unnamed protein product [Pedinophyceae sp. YPF-701]|nr:unnamed protein product [Pedinophyceae sp. YPF-701]